MCETKLDICQFFKHVNKSTLIYRLNLLLGGTGNKNKKTISEIDMPAIRLGANLRRALNMFNNNNNN